MVEIDNCSFGHYNTIYKYSKIRNSSFGDFTYVARNSLIQHTHIGNFCCIGPNVSLGLGAHPSTTFVSSHPLFYSTKRQAGGLSILDKDLFDEYLETTIGHDVWIGANAIIKAGITIGNGAIIASGAVITKDVAPYSVVGGIPAKHLKYRFSEEQIAFLNQFKWWKKDLYWLKENKDLFTNIELLMDKYAHQKQQ
ncbi:CatB-related O-acetyltransferase [Pseudopedobacter beijingensis]|uniref:CatB-related O-acetyltransferase n=1 Tax=Pseudopedobacter beijingensis TaxID=1207056 RepID=A0ABW4I8I4_9SPHI